MIVCCGEALIDMLPRKMPDGTDVYLPTAGGAVFNTAITLGRLGEATGFLSGLSTDLFGEQLEQTLAASSVDYSYSRRSRDPTTLAFVKLVDGNAQYAFYDENTAGRLLEERHLPELGEEVKALHFGAISLISEPCGSTYEALMAREHQCRVISLDPNIRPGFIEDEALHRSRINRMIGMSDIIKVSDEDFEWLMGGHSFAGTAKSWIEAGASVVIMTMGKQGCRVITANHDITVDATEASVVDTVGAGDSFNGGLLAGLSRSDALSKSALGNLDHAPLEQALILASRVAAVTVSRAGANPPWQKEL